MARGKARVALKLPEKGLREMLKRYGEAALEEVEPIFRAAAADALARMIELAPYETGELESSAVMTTRVTPRARRSYADYEFTAEHASIVHELPPDSRGVGTRAKPGNEFGPAGPKYVERVLRGFKLAPRLAEGLRKFWRKQKKVVR